jgi:hypothetical protein
MRRSKAVLGWLAAVSLASLSPAWAQDYLEAVPPRGGQGRVQIITTPPQAEAYMEGVDLGPTPIDTVFPSGRQTLILTLNGVEASRQRVNVWPDSTTTVNKNLTLPIGSLILKTNPVTCDCKVSVDSIDVGSTQGGPLTLNNLHTGTHVIDVSDGKQSKEYNVLILPEQSVQLLVDFTGE